jgi:predicted AAA+ superfamily ATPase
VLRDGAKAGAFFETFVITEVLKSYLNAGELDPPLYFYRGRDQADQGPKEIDLLIWQNGLLHPLEIKKTAAPGKNDIKAFSALDVLGDIQRGPGGVICLSDRLLPLHGDDLIIPLKLV